MNPQQRQWLARTFLLLLLAIGLYCIAYELQYPWSLLFPAYRHAVSNFHEDWFSPDFASSFTIQLFILPLFAFAWTRVIGASIPFQALSVGHRSWRWGIVLLIVPSWLLASAWPDWKGVPAWQIFGAEVGFFLFCGLLMIGAGIWLLRLAARQDAVSEAAVSEEGVWPPAPIKHGD